MFDGFIRARITGRVDDALAILVGGDYWKRFAVSYIIDGIVPILLAPTQQKIRIRGLELHSDRDAGHCVFFFYNFIKKKKKSTAAAGYYVIFKIWCAMDKSRGSTVRR